MAPRVSVIIPVYNQEKYVVECLESVLHQDYENLEVLVVDDGSSDATPDIVRGFGQQIRYIRQDNRGAAAALNVGLRSAQGSLVAWLSADDAYLPGKIHMQVRKLQDEPDLALIYTDWVMIDAQGREMRTVRSPYPPSERFVREMLVHNFINGSSILVRKECFERVGYFDESLRASVDGDMWFRLLRCGYRFGRLPEPLVQYRWHAGNLSHDYRLMRFCKDQVLAKAVETFSVQQLFADLLADGSCDTARQYEALALALVRGFNFSAARAALRASGWAGFSPRRAVLLGALRVLESGWMVDLIARVRAGRRRWLD